MSSIYADVIGAKSSRYRNVASQDDKFSILSRAVVGLRDRKTTAHDVISMFVKANFNPEGETVVFSRATTPLDVVTKLLD